MLAQVLKENNISSWKTYIFEADRLLQMSKVTQLKSELSKKVSENDTVSMKKAA
jgi:hypothetical protein